MASNPFRNVITFIYRTNIGDYSEEEFTAGLTAKYETSLEEVSYKNNATGRIKEREIKNIKKIQAIEKYSESFAMWSDINQTFEINQIAYLNEQYCYEVQRMNYQNGITVKNLIQETDRFELLGDEEYYNRYSL